MAPLLLTPRAWDLDHSIGQLAAATVKVKEVQGSPVKLCNAEFELLNHVQDIRDYMVETLHKQHNRATLQEIFNGDRVAQVRKMLEQIELSEMNRRDSRLPTCQSLCHCIEQVVLDIGESETLRSWKCLQLFQSKMASEGHGEEPLSRRASSDKSFCEDDIMPARRQAVSSVETCASELDLQDIPPCDGKVEWHKAAPTTPVRSGTQVPHVDDLGLTPEKKRPPFEVIKPNFPALNKSPKGGAGAAATALHEPITPEKQVRSSAAGVFAQRDITTPGKVLQPPLPMNIIDLYELSKSIDLSELSKAVEELDPGMLAERCLIMPKSTEIFDMALGDRDVGAPLGPEHFDMAAEDGDGDDESECAVWLWLRERRLEQYFDVFLNQGYDDLDIVAEAGLDEISHLTAACRMPRGHIRHLARGLEALRRSKGLRPHSNPHDPEGHLTSLLTGSPLGARAFA